MIEAAEVKHLPHALECVDSIRNKQCRGSPAKPTTTDLKTEGII